MSPARPRRLPRGPGCTSQSLIPWTSRAQHAGAMQVLSPAEGTLALSTKPFSATPPLLSAQGLVISGTTSRSGTCRAGFSSDKRLPDALEVSWPSFSRVPKWHFRHGEVTSLAGGRRFQTNHPSRSTQVPTPALGGRDASLSAPAPPRLQHTWVITVQIHLTSSKNITWNR